MSNYRINLWHPTFPIPSGNFSICQRRPDPLSSLAWPSWHWSGSHGPGLSQSARLISLTSVIGSNIWHVIRSEPMKSQKIFAGNSGTGKGALFFLPFLGNLNVECAALAVFCHLEGVILKRTEATRQRDWKLWNKKHVKGSVKPSQMASFEPWTQQCPKSVY